MKTRRSWFKAVAAYCVGLGFAPQITEGLLPEAAKEPLNITTHGLAEEWKRMAGQTLLEAAKGRGLAMLGDGKPGKEAIIPLDPSLTQSTGLAQIIDEDAVILDGNKISGPEMAQMRSAFEDLWIKNPEGHHTHWIHTTVKPAAGN